MVVRSPFVNMSPQNKCHGWVGECDVFGCTFVLWPLQHFRSFNLLSAHSHSLDEKQCGPRSAGFMFSKKDLEFRKRLHAGCTY